MTTTSGSPTRTCSSWSGRASAGPGPNDWEVTLRTCDPHRLEPGEHDLQLEAADGSHLSGRALLRYSDGSRHLFRGDGHLTGYDDPA